MSGSHDKKQGRVPILGAAVSKARRLAHDIEHSNPARETHAVRRIGFFFAQLLVIAGMEARSDKLLQRASSLTYTTILSLFPLIFLISSAFSFFYTQEDEQRLIDTMQQFILPPAQNMALDAVDPELMQKRREDVESFTTAIRDMSESYRNAAAGLGFAGFLGVLLTAGILYKSIEDAFEASWETGVAGGFVKSVTNFTTFLFMAPLLIGLSITASSIIVRLTSVEVPSMPGVVEAVVEAGDGVGTDGATGADEPTTRAVTAPLNGSQPYQPKSKLGEVVIRLFPPLFNSIMLALAYMLIPNTRVRLQYALVGGLFAGLCWEAAKLGFVLYVFNSATRRQLFQAFGAIPVFLIWIYFTWIVFLAGNLLTYALQNFQRLRVQYFQARRVSVLDGRLLLALALTAAESFNDGRKGVAEYEFAQRLSLAFRDLDRALALLVRSGVLMKTEDGCYTLARPAAKLPVRGLLELGCDPGKLVVAMDEHGERLRGHLRAIQERVVAAADDQTLEDLLADMEAGPA